jgi:hypothetical protein
MKWGQASPPCNSVTLLSKLSPGGFQFPYIIPYLRFMSDFAQLLVDLILQPGSSLKLVPVINVVILALLVLMTYLLYTKIAVIHIIVMSTLAVGLLISVNW